MKYKVWDKVSFIADGAGLHYTIYDIKEIDGDCYVTLSPFGMFYHEKLFKEAVEKKLYTFTVPFDSSETKTMYNGYDLEMIIEFYNKYKGLIEELKKL